MPFVVSGWGREGWQPNNAGKCKCHLAGVEVAEEALRKVPRIKVNQDIGLGAV